MDDSQFAYLRGRLEQAWDERTSAGGFTAERPSTGQCAVVALVVHDMLGGEILRVVNAGDSHYFNRIDGNELDLTRDQFAVWFPSPVETRTREYLESSATTMERYLLLKQHLADIH